MGRPVLRSENVGLRSLILAFCLVWPLAGELRADRCVGDCRDGRGVLIDTVGNPVYTGTWRAGRFHGRGIFYYKNGERYEGDFRDGRPHGRGAYFDARDRVLYRGELRDGQRHGQGEYNLPDGTRRTGRFERDRPVVEPAVDDSSEAGTREDGVRTDEGELRVGADRFELYLNELRGRSVGVVVNHTSTTGREAGGGHLIEALRARGVVVARAFTPEHGLDGRAGPGDHVSSGYSQRFGLPVISLYGRNKKPSRRALAGIDVLVYDIQDVGVRFYTYFSTLHYVMEACARYNLPLIVLDRPNPNGFYVDGPVLRRRYRSFVGMHPVPLVHGMTTGEFARMIDGEKWLGRGARCRLRVVPVAGYRRADRYRLQIRPSPNLPNMQSVYLYPSLGLMEATVLSVGRGTEYPFQIFGHPELPGPFRFRPRPNAAAGRFLKLDGRDCRGQDLRYEESAGRPGLQLGWLLRAYREFPKNRNFFHRKRFTLMAGTPALLRKIESGWSEERIRASWRPEIERFKRMRAKYLLYE